MVEGRSKSAFKTWLTERPTPGATRSRSPRWTDSPDSTPLPLKRVPAAVAVMDLFHVVRLAGNAPD